MSDGGHQRLTAPDNGQSGRQSLEADNSHRQQNNQHQYNDSNYLNPQMADGVQLRRTSSETSDRSGSLRYGARNVIELFIPVTICMIIVVGTMKLTDSYHYSSQSIIWYAQMMYTDQSVDTGTRVWQSFANALILLVFIAIMTTFLILLYKFKFYGTIHGWLIISSLLLLFMFALNYVAEILKIYNIPMDYFTLCIFIWNFGVVGMFCIHWKGPLLLQQAYLITMSALMALTLIRCLPDWTIWTVLGIVSVWDLIAVLCPKGPLRILVEIAQERNEQIFPALIYSSMMVWELGSSILSTTVVSSNLSVTMADNRDEGKPNRNRKHSDRQNSQSVANSNEQSSKKGKSRQSNERMPAKRNQHPVVIHYEDGAQTPEVAFIVPSVTTLDNDRLNRSSNRVRRSNDNDNIVEPGSEVMPRDPESGNHDHHHHHHHMVGQDEDEERGVKLGLGDFIFYSVLVGKASSYGDWTITLSCYISILVGLCLTLSLLAVFKKALPALPISIAFGLSSFFLSYLFVVPLAEILAMNQVFI